VAALVETDWKAEGFRGIVIATHSEYVARGTTEYMPCWRNELTSEWKVKRENMDLWDRLLTATEAWQSEEFLVMFYVIRRDLNRADRYVT
jgi:ribonuclease HI